MIRHVYAAPKLLKNVHVARVLPANASEKATLNSWISNQTGRFPYRFVPGEYGSLDPRSQTEDMGDDAVKASTYAIANWKKMIPNLVAWTNAGIAFTASQKTWSYLFTLDPATRKIERRSARDDWNSGAFSITPDGSAAAFLASGPASFPEIYIAPVTTMAAAKITERVEVPWPVRVKI